MGVTQSMCKNFGDFEILTDLYSKSRCPTLKSRCPTLKSRCPTHTSRVPVGQTSPKFLHMLWVTPISYPESLSAIQGATADIWTATGLEA